MAGNEMDPLVFPGFRLIVEIAQGEFGSVWRARELESQRLVALKVYRPECLRRAGFVSGLDQAVVAAREFSHPAAARVFGLVEARAGGGLALVSELIGGEVLGRALQRNVRLAAARALRLAKLISEGLGAAHARRLAVGTLHPGQVVISGESAKVLGVGTSAVEGLPARYDHAPEEGRFAPAVYAAPEVLSGSAPSARSDVFSLGALLYHMLTGLTPYRAKDLAGLKLERAEGLRWPRGADSLIPPEAMGLVGRALELDPALRPSAADFAAAAGKILSGLGAAGRGDEKGSTRMDLAAPVPGVPEMLPSEPRVAAPKPAAPAGAPRLRDVLMGAAAAALLMGAGLVLGRYLWTPPAAMPAPAPPEQPTVQAPVRPAAGQPVGAPTADDSAARREFEAIQAVLAEKPANLAPVKERLAELARKCRGTEWGLRAALKLDELTEAERAERAAAYRKLSERAAELERRERFGEAAALFEKLPATLAGSDLAARAAEEAGAIRNRAAERYGLLEKRAERSVADGDLAAAVLDYQRAVDEFGIPELAAAAARRLGELGRIQEKNAQDIARRNEQARLERAKAALGKALESAWAQVGMFKYAPALSALAKAGADPEQPEESRKLLARYAELVRGEQKLFELACKRVSGGIRELNITVGGSEVLTVKKLDEKGLVADGAEVTGVLFTWDRIPAAQAYRAVKLTVDVTSAEEQLELAAFAFHRGQAMEMENSLKLAGELDPALKDAAAAQAELCRQVEAVLKPRRAGAAGGEERRRTAPERP